MSDSSSPGPGITIAITPMHKTEQGLWESGPRQGAQFLLVELVRADGEDAEVVVECRDERTAALAARVAAGTLAALGLAGGGAEDDEDNGGGQIEAFDEDTAAILADNPTPEVEAPAGEWRASEDDEDEDDEGEGDRPDPRRLS
jgi:hypothetical protein